jgi:nucleoside-diphosphate-sugar epimerase
MTNNPTISIFGATGGSGLSTLRFCLANSYRCTVMVRNTEKLLNLLSVSEPPSNLTIVNGAIQDAPAVRSALLTSEGRLVDIVISCVGFVPSLKPTSKSINPFKNIDDLHICEQGTKNILSAISDIKSDPAQSSSSVAHGIGHEDDINKVQGPLLVVLSTTGISSAGRDIPLLMAPLYHGLLGPPHVDKRAMEDLLRSSSSQPWVIIRPSLLRGDGKGEPTGKKIRVGIEKDGKHEKLAIGYTIKREDVGYWIFKEIVQGDWRRWVGRAVTLTH